MKHRILFLLTGLFFTTHYGTAQEFEWVERTSMPKGKHHPVTFALDGFGYVVTGSTNNGGQSRTRDIFKYDPNLDEWSTLNDFPGAARSYAIGQAYNGKGYLVFGASNTNYLRDIWEYDPSSDSWDLLTTCPCTGGRHPAFIIQDGKIFVGLGDGSGGNLSDWWTYDMLNDSWEQHDNLPGPNRHHPYMFSAGGEVYVGLGHGNSIYRTWFRFNADDNTWDVLNLFPGEARVAGTQFFHNEIGYVLSGDGSDHSFMQTGEFWKYDHDSDTWEELTPHPGISKWAPGSFVIEDSVYFLGGENRQTGNITNDVWKYQLVPTPIDTTPPLSIAATAGSEIHVFPNPNDGQFQIKGLHSPLNVKGYNTLGQEINLTRNQHSFIVPDDFKGVLLLNIQQKDQWMTRRLVIQ